MKPGINCESIDQINARVDDGQFNDDACKDNDIHCASIPRIRYLTLDQRGTNPSRSREKILKVFVAAFVDKNGNFHNSNTIHTVLEPVHWIG
jgi:Type IV conjugative transfer system lipoprotein (TraV)